MVPSVHAGMAKRSRAVGGAVKLMTVLLLSLSFWEAAEGFGTAGSGPGSYCMSWRLAVETNDVREWRTVPTQCRRHVETYMMGGQYTRDLTFILDHIEGYVDGIALSGDGMDAWILDVDDTCISNVLFYRRKQFGCEPYDPKGFKEWAEKGECPAIAQVLKLFEKLVGKGFKVFLVTGRDEDTLGEATRRNLLSQGFNGFQQLFLRTTEHKGQSAVQYKSAIRKQLVEEGYRIWGNIGDQWSDLQGDFVGDQTFKLPNPMYFVP